MKFDSNVYMVNAGHGLRVDKSFTCVNSCRSSRI